MVKNLRRMIPEMTIPITLAKYVPQNCAAFDWSPGIITAATEGAHMAPWSPKKLFLI